MNNKNLEGATKGLDLKRIYLIIIKFLKLSLFFIFFIDISFGIRLFLRGVYWMVTQIKIYRRKRI
jgi:hypothetical protein